MFENKKENQRIGKRNIEAIMERMEWKYHRDATIDEINFLYLYFRKGDEELKLTFQWKRKQWILIGSRKSNIIDDQKKEMNKEVNRINKDLEGIEKRYEQIIDSNQRDFLKENRKHLERLFPLFKDDK